MVEAFDKIREKRPNYEDLVMEALHGMPRRSGASSQSICVWVEERFENLPKNYKKEINKTLKILVGNALLDQIKNTFYLPPNEKVSKKRKTSKKKSKK
jgi:hypothetical protein